MEPLAQLLTVSVAVGVFNGLAFLRSDLENKSRHRSGHSANAAQSNLARQLAKQWLQSILGLAAFMGLPLLPLSFLGLLPLQGTNLRWFFAAYLVAIAVGKLLRYAYWKRRLRGSLV